MRKECLALGSGLVFCSVLLWACSEQEVITATRNLARPGPLALVCAGRVGEAGSITGLDSSYCENVGSESEVTGLLYGFVANTSRGEVAMFGTGDEGEQLVDLDKSSPGFGFIPVGNLPTDLKATKDGCRVVVANSGSCDLSIIDVQGALQVSAGERKDAVGSVVSRVIPRTASGPLRARPREMVIVPGSVPDKGDKQCPSLGSYRAYVTFPRCQLVAEIDLTTGMILQGVVLKEDGFHFTQNPSCATECVMRGESGWPDGGAKDVGAPDTNVDANPQDTGSDALVDGGTSDSQASQDSAGVDAGVSDSGAVGDSVQEATEPKASLAGVLPYSIVVDEEGKRVFVSSAGANFISVIDVDGETGVFGQPRQILLHGEMTETTRLALSPSTRRLGRFLYAIAKDRSVRVISVDLEKECETNVDLAQIQDREVSIDTARCFVVGDEGGPSRRVTAESSGLRFGGRLPRDVVFVQVAAGEAEQIEDGEETTTEESDVPQALPLVGTFALIAVSDGNIYVVDVEDDKYVLSDKTAIDVLHLPHRIRNRLMGTDAGTPDAAVIGISGAGDGGVPAMVTVAGGENLGEGGVLLRVMGEQVASEWAAVYEARLLERFSGQVSIVGETLRLKDPGAGFCKAGVRGRVTDQGGRPIEHGDILVLLGCTDDDQCGLYQVCRRPMAMSTEYGLCLEKSRETELFQHCSDFLQGQREFLVQKAEDDSLILDPLPSEPQMLFKQDPQPAKGCKSNDDCGSGYLCAIADRLVEGNGELSLKQGECFRPGCRNNDDCPSGTCQRPLYGGDKICAPVRLPLEVGKSCKADEDCSPDTKRLFV
ncbi:MAG: hypothetical protein V1754_08660, partial [Pseudomonadota bacterium]